MAGLLGAEVGGWGGLELESVSGVFATSVGAPEMLLQESLHWEGW